MKYLRYWVDDNAGKVFCLVELPTPTQPPRCTVEAHGLVADQVYEVVEGE